MSQDLPSVSDIRTTVKDVVGQMLRADASAPAPRSQRELINEAQVLAAKDAGVLVVPEGALVTPLARDAAERFQVEIRFGNSPGARARATTAPASEEGQEPAPRETREPVAIGSDHGGFKLKEIVKKHLESSGFSVIDVGTTSESAVDYPDFAARVGKAVSLGEARWGVFVDGAGIGGAMTLNKVPGVFAATCHDAKAAQNARGHNSANVLCLGSGWVDADKAKVVVDAFFGTGFEGGRHLRRVAKIRGVERAFLLRAMP